MATLIPKYDQGATGAVNRAINLKLAESVSVADFGATGNGISDDKEGLTATMFWSSIMKVRRRYPSRGFSTANLMMASRSQNSSQKSRGIGALCSLTLPYRSIQE